MKYQLAIAHRVCPILAKTVSHYADKFELVKEATNSLARAIANIKVKLTVILDGCPVEYERLFDDVFGGGKITGVDYRRVSTPAIGNAGTYRRQMEVLSEDSVNAEFLYFSEDDYIYRRDAFVAMMDFLVRRGVDFVSPLDHPDVYQEELERQTAGTIKVSSYCHWREVASTCCTFMLKSATWTKAEKSLSYYAKGGADFIMWELLTKKKVFSPWVIFEGGMRYLFSRRRNWMNLIPALAWARLGPRLLFAPRFYLWSPMPSLAVHLCMPSLPPFSDAIMQGRGNLVAVADKMVVRHAFWGQSGNSLQVTANG